ncbi:MAG: hypothetical protein SynsKO_33220 [Synoicihabitans sp.]
MVTIAGNREVFAARLRELSRTNALEDVLEKLSVNFDDVPASAAPGFVAAMFDAGEEFPKERPGMFNEDPLYTAQRMIFSLLKKVPQSEERATILRKAIEHSTGAVLPVLVLAFIEPDKNEQPVIRLFDDDLLMSMRRLGVSKLEAIADSGAIWKSRVFPRLIVLWRRWAGDDPVHKWLKSELTTPSRKLEFLTRFIGESTSGEEVVNYNLSPKSLEPVLSLEDVAKDIAKLSPESPRERAAYLLLTRALEQKRIGHPYEHFEVEAKEISEGQPKDVTS